MHKQFAALAAPLLYLAYASAQADTVRYGSALVSINDQTFGVQRKCSDPDHYDDVGYTLGSYDRQGFRIEEWMCGPRNGMTYILTFGASKLKRIEFKR